MRGALSSQLYAKSLFEVYKNLSPYTITYDLSVSNNKPVNYYIGKAGAINITNLTYIEYSSLISIPILPGESFYIFNPSDLSVNVTINQLGC